jgi:uncharacterized protein YigE (DUF2233 family)
MTLRNALWSAVFTTALLFTSMTPQAAPDNGVVKVRSAYSLAETIARIKQDVAAKKIMFFFEDKAGQVWVLYNDFAHIARRHHISDREKAFAMAAEVIGSVTSTVAK